MPHIVVKVRAGYSPEQKRRLSPALSNVSVGIEDVRPADWTERVYRPDVVGKLDTLYKRPGLCPACIVRRMDRAPLARAQPHGQREWIHYA